MHEKIYNFYKTLLATADSAGMKIVSDSHCAKLLAWTYCFGGGNEQIVKNLILHENILYAKKRFNIIGGEIVAKDNLELLTMLKQYLDEADLIIKGKSKEVPEWANEICDYYKLERIKPEL